MTILNDSQDGSYRLPSRAALEPIDTVKSLKIGIVGAGIGGLIAAVALLKSGHDVEMFEKSRFKSEVGAAICAPPNSSRVLAYYGFDFESARATRAESFIIYDDPSNPDVKKMIPCTDYAHKYGAPWYFFHRVDLHSELRKMATEPTDTQPRIARLHLGTSVSRVDENGTLHFEDGTSAQKDVVIAADGIRNIGLIYPPQFSVDANGNDISDREDFANTVIVKFPKTIQSVCRQAKGVGQWSLFTRTPLERLTRGRVVVIGDAAHPMPPLRAQGAAMAIEDAAALGVLLSNLDSKEEISARLDMFNELRLKRVAATQILSSEHEWKPTRLSEEQRGYFDGKVPQTEDDVYRYSFEHDVIRDALKILQEYRQRNSF
ncbi:salicylate protein [Colletotrichum incanum]|uniref:Salicylate protein n=1 Tax=Colletotrichum incanum TaxID=1573173 RepID=A0A166QXT7_COLIC|nr:salicylate protein [Colletotrichum incanum]